MFEKLDPDTPTLYPDMAATHHARNRIPCSSNQINNLLLHLFNPSFHISSSACTLSSSSTLFLLLPCTPLSCSSFKSQSLYLQQPWSKMEGNITSAPQVVTLNPDHTDSRKAPQTECLQTCLALYVNTRMS
ncbi:hypothetical protein V8G54_030776 [Vigna mungo]|uniref:Uncharacterized protein n=1 Tax=Vigna mungo TaxID=3915 RepID=A0AAQ3MXD3_VIGMU